MAKAPEADPKKDADKVPKAGAKSAAPKTDPLAGKSAEEKKATIEAAKAKDEKAKAALEAKRAAPKKAARDMRPPKPLVVDAGKKAAALVIMAEHAELQSKVTRARKLHKGTPEFTAARIAVKAKKRALNLLYAEAPDSVQAAETEFAATA